jgi:hypothetical protein
LALYTNRAEQSSFIDAKMICKKIPGARNQLDGILALNNSYSALGRHIAPKLVCLELFGHDGSEYVRKYFLACL